MIGDASIFNTHHQSCEMSILLHGAKPSNQILPEEKHVNRDSLDAKIEQNLQKGYFRITVGDHPSNFS